MALAGAQMNFYNARRHEQGEFTPNVSLIFDALAGMKALVESSGAHFAVSISPADTSVHHERAQAVFSRFGMQPADYDLALAERILKQRLEQMRTPFIYLSPDFARAGSQRELYSSLDIDRNAAGNHLAAEILFEWLRPQVEMALGR